MCKGAGSPARLAGLYLFEPARRTSTVGFVRRVHGTRLNRSEKWASIQTILGTDPESRRAINRQCAH
jgi:hypothetical protein